MTIVFQTFIAILIVAVVSFAGSAVIFFPLAFLERHSIFSYLPFEPLRILDLFVGNLVGMLLSKAACDAALKNYSGKSVFVVLAILYAYAWMIELWPWTGVGWGLVELVAQTIVVLSAGFAEFWVDDPYTAKNNI